MVPAMVGRFAPCLACALLVLALPALAARARNDDPREARVTSRCGKGTSSELRLRSRDGSIRLEFEVRRRRPRERWRVVIVHERRIAWRGVARTGASGSFRVRRTLADYAGVDRVTVRASGANGLRCEAYARLRG